MTALTSPNQFLTNTTPLTANQRARAATLEYCAVTAAEQAHAKLRAMTALDTMYAYFGSDEARD